MKKERIKIVVDVEIEYENAGSRKDAIRGAKELHVDMGGCGPNGVYSAMSKKVSLLRTQSNQQQ